MNVQHLLALADDDAFRSGLEEYLSENLQSDALEDLCNRGGYPWIDEITVDHISRNDGEEIAFSAAIEFTEVMPTLCADVELDFEKSCVLNFTIDEHGEVELSDVDAEWDGGEYST